MVLLSKNNGEKTASVQKIVFDQHCHAYQQPRKAETRKIVEREIAHIREGSDVGGALAKKHRRWQQEAEREGEKLLKVRAKRALVVDYAIKHPDQSGREVEENTDGFLSRYGVDMARLREMKKQGDVTDLNDLIQKKTTTF